MLGKLIVETGISKSSVDSLQDAIANAVKEGVREGLSGADFRGLLDFGEVANKFAASLNAALKTINPAEGIKIDGAGAASDDIKQIVTELKEVKEAIASINQTMSSSKIEDVMLRSAAAIGQIATRLQEVQDLVDSINNKEFSIKSVTNTFLKNGVNDDADRFKLQINQYKQLKSVIEEVQNAYESMSSTIREMSLDGGETRTLNTILQYAPKSTGGLNRTSVVAGIVEMTDLVQAAIPLIEKYNAKVDQIGQGRVPKIEIPDLANVKAAEEALENYKTVSDEAKRSIEERNQAAQEQSAKTENAIKDITQATKEEIQRLCDEIGVLFEGLKSKIEETFSFEGPISNVSAFKERVDELSSAIAEVSSQAANIKIGSSLSAGKTFSQDIDIVDPARLDAEWKSHHAEIAREAEKAAEKARIAAEKFYQSRDEAAKKAAIREEQQNERLTRRLIDSWKEAEDKAAEAAEKQAQKEAKAAAKAEAAAQKKIEAEERAAAKAEAASRKEADAAAALEMKVIQLRTEYIQLRQEHETTYNAHKDDIDGCIDKMEDAASVTKEQYQQMRRQILLYREEIKTGIEAQERAAAKEVASEKQVAALRAKVQNYIKNNTKAYEAYGESLDRILNELSHNSQISKERLAELTAEFKNIDMAARQVGASGKTFFEKLQEGWQRFGGWSIVTKSMMAIVRGAKDMVKSVQEIDSAMTELRKVTDLTAAGYERFYENALEASQKIGTSVSDTINAAADFARLGFASNEALDLANAALVYKHVGDGIESVSDASESLISTIKAFGAETYDAMQIVDMFNEVGNNFAISSTGIGEALVRSASALEGAGNTLEESIGLITAANAVIQNPQSVGTSMKTLTMYLRAAKTELEEAGESSEGCANSVSELRDEIKALSGVDIMIDDNTFKSTYQIIKEISKVWDTLSDTTQANITGLIGGKRNANVIQALMKNFQDAEAAMTTAAESSGSAMRENEKYLDSIAGKLDIMHGKIEALANGIINSGILKFLIDTANIVLDVANGLNKIHILLPAIVTTVSVLFARNLAKDATDAVNKLLTMLSVKGVTGAQAAEMAALATSHLSQRQRELVLSELKKAAATGVANDETMKEVVEAISATKAQEEHAAANYGVAASLGTMKAAMPIWGSVISIAGIALSIIFSLVGSLEDMKNASIEAANTARDTFEQNKKTYEENLSSIDKLESRFRELSKGVDDNGRNVSLTSDEYDEYKSVIQQIVDISPSIVKGYDDEKRAILDYKNAIYEARKAQDQMYDSDQEMYFAEMSSRFDAWQSEIQNADSEVLKVGSDVAQSIRHMLELFDIIESGINGVDFGFEGQIYSYQNFMPVNFTLEQLRKLNEYKDQILTLAEASGVYSETQLYDLIDWFGKLSLAFSKESEVYQKAKTELVEWVEFQDWFVDETNKNLANSFLSTIDQLIQPGDNIADVSELRSAAHRLFEEIHDIFSDEQLGVSNIEGLATAVSNGETSLEELEKALDMFEIGAGFFYSQGAIDSVKQYFMNMAEAAKQTGESASEAEAMTYQYSKLTDAIGRLSTGYDILSKAMTDIDQNGGLGADMIKTIQDALDEGEKLTDYLYEENGMIKLNTKAWENRSKALLENNISTAESEIEKLNDKLITEGFGGDLAEEEIDTINDRISELEATIEIYKSVLEQEVNNEDPLNVTSMISGIEALKSNANGLITAIKDIQDGKLQDWVSLSLKYPQLLNVEGFDISTLEGQEAALRSVLEKYDTDIDHLIDNKIDLLEAEKISDDVTPERVAEIDVLIENLTAMRDSINLLNESSAIPTTPFDGVSNALDKASKYLDIVKDAQDGIDLDLLRKIRDVFGVDWESVLVKDGDKITGVDADKLKGVIELELEMYDTSGVLKKSFEETWDAALKGEDVKSQFNELSDAMSKASSAMKIVSEYSEKGVDNEFIEDLMGFFGEKGVDDYKLFLDMAKKDGNTFIGMLLSYVEVLYTAAGATDTELNAMHSAWAKNIEDTNKVEKSYDSLTSAISQLTSAHKLLYHLSTGQGSKLETIESIIDLAKNQSLDINDLFVFKDGNLIPNISSISSAINNMFDVEKLRKDLGVSNEIAEAIKHIAEEAIGAENASQALTDTLSHIDTARDIITTIESGESSFLETLKAVQSIAEDTGKSINDFFGIADNKVYWDENAILQWGLGYIDTMQSIGQITPKTAKYMKDLAASEIETAIAAGRLNNAVNITKDALSGISSVSIDAKITYDQFKALTDVSAEYASAIQYNNGVITLNKERFDAVTQSVIALKKAEIEASKAIALEKYQALQSKTNLTAEEEKRINDLYVEIQSYKVLANEIDNATAAYQRFLNTNSSPSGEQFTAAQKAQQVIKDTLYNTESELYGKIGREQYKQAIEFLIEPNIKIGTKAFDEAYKRVESYLEENGKGVQKFANDMISKGLVDPVSGQLDSTIEEIAKKMGVSEDLVRAEIEELNSYGSNIVVKPSADVDTTGIDEAFDKMGRYIQDNAEGTKNFLNDLIENGIYDPIAGTIDFTLEEIADKMGLSEELVSSMINELNRYGAEITIKPSIEPEISTEKDGEAKKSLSDIIQSAEDATTLVEDLNGREVDLDVSQANEKLGDLDSKVNSILGGLERIPEIPLSISAQPALSNIGKVTSGLAKILTELNEIVKRGLIKVNIVETTHKYSVDHSGTSVGNNYPYGTPTGGYSVANGSRGVPGGKALVGERGREIVVDPDTNRWYTVGDKGPEFVHLPKGALVFNAKETDELMSKGGIYAKAGPSMASGTTNKSSSSTASVWYSVIRKSDGGYVIFHGTVNQANDYAKKNKGSVLASLNTKEDAQKRAKYYIQREQGTSTSSNSSSSNAKPSSSSTKTSSSNNSSSSSQTAKQYYYAMRKSDGGYVIYHGTAAQAQGYAGSVRASILYSSDRKNLVEQKIKEYQNQNNASSGNNISSGNATSSSGKRYYFAMRRSDGSYVVYNGTVDQARGYANSVRATILYTSDRKNLVEQKIKEYSAGVQSGSNSSGKTSSGKSSTGSSDIATGTVVKPSIGSSGSVSSSGSDYDSGTATDYGNTDENSTDPIDKLVESYSNLNKQLEHAIEHQKYLYDVANRSLDYNGMGRSLQEQAHIYQQEMETAQEGISELMANGIDDSDERLQQLEETYWQAHRNLYSVFDSINALYVDGLNDKIDSVQGAYDTLKQVSDQFNETGTIDIDQFQQLLENGIQYLDYLELINGQYVLNQEAIDNLVKAEKEQLAIESALAYLNRILEAAESGSVEKIRELANETQNISTESWFDVWQMLNVIESTGQVSGDLMEIIRQNVSKLQRMSDAVVSGFGEIEESAVKVEDKIKDINENLEHLIQHQLYLYDVAERAGNYDGMADSLARQAEIYKQEMDNAQQGIDALLAQGVQDTDERMQQIEEMYWSAHRNLYSTFDKINALYVDALNNKIDSIQSAYDTLLDLSDQYNGTGEISIDQFQQLLSNGIQYLNYLDLVNGKYVLNKEAVEKLVKAEKERLAIESALSYLNKVSEAAEAGSIEAIRELANETQNISSDNWYNVTNMMNALERSGKVPADLMVIIRQNVQKLQNISGSVVMNAQDASEITEKIKDDLEKQEAALDKIIDLTEDMIKQEVNDHIEAIQKEVSLFKEIIDLKKESLDKTREEDSYQKNVNDKLKEIATLQSRIDMLSLDDSRTAQAERSSLVERLAELQEDLANTQSDHSYQAQVDALDKMSEDYEKSREDEINALEDSISSAEKLYQQAIERINTGWSTLYQDLVNWNIESGSVLTSEITDNWRMALNAAQQYGGYVQALRGIHQQLESYGSTNDTLKYRVEDLPRYHGGGIVSNEGSINDKEVLAVLKKGELVLDSNQKESLFALINLKEYLSKKLGKPVGDFVAPIRQIQSAVLGARYVPSHANVSTNQAIDFRPEFNISIESTGEMTRDNAKNFGETIAEMALDKLYSAFERRGAGTIFSGKFKANPS